MSYYSSSQRNDQSSRGGGGSGSGRNNSDRHNSDRHNSDHHNSDRYDSDRYNSDRYNSGRNQDLPPIRDVFPEIFSQPRYATPPTRPQEPPSGRFVQHASDMTPQRSSDRPGVPTRTPRYDDPSRKHPCDECGKNFPTPSALDTHKNTHTGARPYVCTRCGKTFSVKSNLRRHEQSVHSGGPAPEEHRGSSSSSYYSSSRR
ncbi:hypothetical protein BU17DRAFT_89618 [Hysterangium stoloniferum]|nr:hypothetical protein BU17DRAFT_89618 [Hysterangium stoloniferum]